MNFRAAAFAAAPAKDVYLGRVARAARSGARWTSQLAGVGLGLQPVTRSGRLVVYTTTSPTLRFLGQLHDVYKETGTRFAVVPSGPFSAPTPQRLGGGRPRQWLLSTLDEDHRGRHRPVPGGVGAGGPKVTTGTNGGALPDAASHRLLMLTNKHVVGDVTRSELGTPLLQPGVYDGGRASDQVAKVVREVLLDPDGDNVVDGAACAPDDENLVSRGILGIGVPRGLAEAAPGMACWKAGRTTAVTKGVTFSVATDAWVSYGGGQVIHFVDQVAVRGTRGPFCQGGDSGSMTLTPDRRFLGLLFAGSDDGTTLLNPASEVLRTLGLRAP